MNITGETKLMDLLDQYPWLMDEAVKLGGDAKKLNSPLVKIFLKKATISDVSEKTGIPEEELIGWATRLIASYEQESDTSTEQM